MLEVGVGWSLFLIFLTWCAQLERSSDILRLNPCTLDTISSFNFKFIFNSASSIQKLFFPTLSLTKLCPITRSENILFPSRGLVAKFWKKCGEMQWKKIFTVYFLHNFAVNRGEFFIFTAYSVFIRKDSSLHGFEPLNYCVLSTAYSTAPTVTCFFDTSCECKSDWVNVGKQMRWNFVRNEVNFAVKF